MDIPDSIRYAEDFRVTIAWSGAEDKPFPRALLVASSEAGRVEERRFWAVAEIGCEEYARLLDVLEQEGRVLEAGTYGGDARGYYVEVEAEASVVHVHLGFSEDTVRTLDRLNAALHEEHREPIRNILDRLSTALPE